MRYIRSFTWTLLVVKIRDAGHVRNRAIYVAIGVNLKGNKEVQQLCLMADEQA